MKKGDYIYYRDKEGNSFPGIILKTCRKRIKVSINHFKDDNIIIYVDPANLKLQEDNE